MTIAIPTLAMVARVATIGDAALGMTMIQRDGDSWFFEDWIDADFNDLEFAIYSVDGVA
jgi:2',3'-cyclic-nucleotide 2'-phosphodiesterase/3'-nucleotidase/5'-nucleotidase